MRTIRRYKLDSTYSVVYTYKNARPCHVSNENGDIYVWILIDDEEAAAEYTFVMYRTNEQHEYEEYEYAYVGTVPINVNTWHVFHVLDNEI